MNILNLNVLNVLLVGMDMTKKNKGSVADGDVIIVVVVLFILWGVKMQA